MLSHTNLFNRFILSLALLVSPQILRAFELIELPIIIEIDVGGQYSFDYNNLGVLNTGFSIAAIDDQPLSLSGSTSFISDLGLLENELLQDSFALYDGTLLLEIEALDQQGGRADIRTTYRMNVDPRMLRRDFLRARFLRQGLVDDRRRALERASAVRSEDLRLMRFVEGLAGARADGRWIRAVRAIEGRADLRFMPSTASDGVLGHYGYDTDDTGGIYVWAVMDRNSKYAVGVTVDRDNDGVANVDDNCPDTANPDQSNSDDDSFGDACDPDDDNDGVADANDNCPLFSNDGQQDFDGDAIGDACDTDADGDTVNDGIDACLFTALGSVVDAEGCSIADRCPCENDWKNHGGYVRCTAHATENFLDAGLISDEEKDAIVSAAGQSDCGSRN